MTEEIDDRLSTIPEDMRKPREKDVLKQIPVRLHVHDHALIKVMLKKDRMSLQKFIGYCVKGFLDGDPNMLRMIKSYRELEVIPRDVKDKHVLSHRERQHILDEIEKGTT